MFEELIEKYGLTGARPEFYSAWTGQFDADFSGWLSRTYLEDVNARYTRLGDEAFGALCTAAGALAENPELCALAAYSRGLLFESGLNEDYLALLGFPRPHTGIQLLDDFFGLLVHLSGIPVVEQRYARRGIPLEYMQASYNSVRIWVNSFKAFYGRWGHDRERPRMVYIEHLRIIRIGRLEFETNWFSGKIVILRSRKDGTVLALSEGGIPVRQDGRISGTNDIWDGQCWYTVFDETQAYYKGHVILPEGSVSPYVSVCLKSEWEPVARRGQNSVNIHIPRDGRLDIPEAMESIRRACTFYPEYFPEREFRTFECHTWLFDPQMAELMGDGSNIVRFQRLFYLFPEATDDGGVRTGAFTEAPFELLTWQPETTLQRRVIEHYRAGGHMFAAGGFILPEGEMPPRQRN